MILVVSEGMEPGDGGMDTRERSSSDGVLQEGTIRPSLSFSCSVFTYRFKNSFFVIHFALNSYEN